MFRPNTVTRMMIAKNSGSVAARRRGASSPGRRAADVTGDGAVEHADHHRDQGGDRADRQRDARAGGDAHEQGRGRWRPVPNQCDCASVGAAWISSSRSPSMSCGDSSGARNANAVIASSKATPASRRAGWRRSAPARGATAICRRAPRPTRPAPAPPASWRPVTRPRRMRGSSAARMPGRRAGSSAARRSRRRSPRRAPADSRATAHPA